MSVLRIVERGSAVIQIVNLPNGINKFQRPNGGGKK
jgi:hypothetical protein